MKKRLVPLAMLMSAMSMNAAVNIERIEPTNWYVGMKDASLQLMVCGKDVRNTEVEVSHPGVRIDSIARLDSPLGLRCRLFHFMARFLAMAELKQNRTLNPCDTDVIFGRIQAVLLTLPTKYIFYRQ